MLKTCSNSPAHRPPTSLTVEPQVLQFLQAEQMDILVAGDSMMRQLYVRLVHMMRGARRVLDYHIHTPGSYSVCAEADRFRMSPVNANRSVESFKKLDLDYLEVRSACYYVVNQRLSDTNVSPPSAMASPASLFCSSNFTAPY